MTGALTVTEVFRSAELVPQGPVPWGSPILETRPGIYVVALVALPDNPCTLPMPDLPEQERQHWILNEPVVYIGCTTRKLTQRIREFYCHRYGAKSPHRGGQAIKLLTCELWLYWSPTDEAELSEKRMLEAFTLQFGQLPFANRK